jgi:tRNA-dihydrouridine synthase
LRIILKKNSIFRAYLKIFGFGKGCNTNQKGDDAMANIKRQIFYSFHYENDVMRVQQIRNIGALEDNKPVSENEWVKIKRNGDVAIRKWIDDNMAYRSCVVVLVGEKTYERPWVKYEIQKAWDEKKGLLGIYIHNIKCPRNGTSNKGPNPFDQFTFTDGERKGEKLSSVVKCHNPKSTDAYNDIRNNIENWIEEAISQRK